MLKLTLIMYQTKTKLIDLNYLYFSLVFGSKRDKIGEGKNQRLRPPNA